jgi:hypothetical protein
MRVLELTIHVHLGLFIADEEPAQTMITAERRSQSRFIQVIFILRAASHSQELHAIQLLNRGQTARFDLSQKPPNRARRGCRSLKRALMPLNLK